MEWKDISTAPLNEPVLIYDDGAVGVAIKLRADWGPRDYWSSKAASNARIHNTALQSTEKPTHWMPLPLPPENPNGR